MRFFDALAEGDRDDRLIGVGLLLLWCASTGATTLRTVVRRVVVENRGRLLGEMVAQNPFAVWLGEYDASLFEHGWDGDKGHISGREAGRSEWVRGEAIFYFQ